MHPCWYAVAYFAFMLFVLLFCVFCLNGYSNENAQSRLVVVLSSSFDPSDSGSGGDSVVEAIADDWLEFNIGFLRARCKK